MIMLWHIIVTHRILQWFRWIYDHVMTLVDWFYFYDNVMTSVYGFFMIMLWHFITPILRWFRFILWLCYDILLITSWGGLFRFYDHVAIITHLSYLAVSYVNWFYDDITCRYSLHLGDSAGLPPALFLFCIYYF